MSRYLRLGNGTTWPEPPAEGTAAGRAAWKLTYDVDGLTREDCLYLASVASAYGYLVENPGPARQALPLIRRALKARA